ncbi:MAG: TetR/AcrR family transcriptional regulator [Erysipelotrichaceae bacterium]|nr:TetR/AcrR family transcriptional regulator [Erysipelotrichaceae bacterium]
MKEDLRNRLSRQLIKNALLELLQTKKSYDINVRELSNKAQVNRSTFYRHYDSVADVLNEVIDDMVQVIKDTNKSSYYDPNHAGDYIYDAVRFFEEHREYDPLLVSDDIAFQKLTSSLAFTVHDSVGRLSYHNKDEEKYLTDFLLSGTYSIIREWISDGRKKPAKEISDLLFRLSAGAVSHY